MREREDNKTARWYVVQDKRTGARCLVEANNQAQAHRRSSEHYAVARPATVSETIELTRAGADVISAPDRPEQLDLEEVVAEPSAGAANGGSAPGAPEAPAPLGAGPLEPEPPKPQPAVPHRQRKASEVFGPGFDRSEPDVG